MSPSHPVTRAGPSLVVLAMLSAASACAGQQRPQAAGAPTADEVANLSYRGIEEAGGNVTLQGGSWEGAPYVEGGASRPRVTLRKSRSTRRRITGTLPRNQRSFRQIGKSSCFQAT